jgi:hypothetical protein
MSHAARVQLLRFLRRASWRDRVETARTLVLATLAEVAVRTMPLERAARLFGARFSREATGGQPHDDLNRLPKWARRNLLVVGLTMDAWPGDGLCLRQSLVAAHRLRSLSPTLHLGVRRSADRVEAHAWIVVDGVAVDARDYVALTDPRKTTSA